VARSACRQCRLCLTLRWLCCDMSAVLRTSPAGIRASEAKAINLSLTVLGMCINARASANASHAPYRDSKLTRILKVRSTVPKQVVLHKLFTAFKCTRCQPDPCQLVPSTLRYLHQAAEWRRIACEICCQASSSQCVLSLQESLGGNARTSLVVAVADAIEHCDETLQSLQFGTRAMFVENAVSACVQAT
jgi:Kinesin motor domain